MEEGYTESEIIVGLSYKPYILWKLMTPTIHYIKNTQIQKKCKVLERPNMCYVF